MGVPISSLPAASALTGAELLPVVQSGQTKRTTTDAIPYVPAGTGAVATTVQAKLRERVSVKDFGAVGDGVTDDTAAFSKAFTFLTLVGGGDLYVPKGRYVVSSDLSPSDNTRIYGAGHDASVLLSRGNPAGDRIFISRDANKSNLTIERLGFEGNWLSSQNESGSNGLITLTYWTNVVVRDCALRYAKTFIFNINKCNTVRIENCLCEYSSRDQIAVWNTQNIQILNNILRHNDDDSISVSSDAGFDNRTECVVSGNQLEDTGSIRVHGRNAVITGNTIRRARATGIAVGVSQLNANGIPGGHNIIISKNVITDVMDRQWFVDGTQTGSSQNRVGISLYISGFPEAGGLAVAPGEIDPATGTVPNPYGYYYNTGTGTPMRAPTGIIVSNNICTRTLPPVAKYSDWGFGQAYTKNGFVDYQVPDAITSGIGIRVELPITNLSVNNNLIAPGRYGIRLEVPGTLANNLAKSVKIANNQFKDCTSTAIDWTSTNSTVTTQDIVIENNSIDCDPFFKSGNRGANGTWASQTTPYAFNLPYVSSAVISGNRIRNVNQIIVQTGVSALQQVLNNLLFADAEVVGFSTLNKGIGVIPAIGDGGQWWLQYEDSDPTSVTYRQSLGANLKNTPGMPTSGKWLTGMSVTSRATVISGTAGSQYVVIGYKRKTTGSTHVLNTDWVEMRCLTGT